MRPPPARLQRRLILSFILLLALALTTSSALFMNRSHDALSDVLGEQAKQIAQTLAMAAESPYEAGDVTELHRLGRELLRSRNLVLVVFYDPAGTPLALACRDPDVTLRGSSGVPDSQLQTQQLMKVRQRNMATLGTFLQVTAPVFDSFRSARMVDAGPPVGTKLLGYLTVGVSQNRELDQFRRVTLLGIAGGCLIVMVSLPMVVALVHRIFQPIRQLVDASQRIAGGQYDTRVDTDRDDDIGALARSFNEMAHRVRQHEAELRIANNSLAEANRDLEQKVHLRTRELEATNQRLSAEIAEKEDFLRAVSHDLNAPLRNISGMATMLLMKHRQQFDEDVIHRLERILKNVEVETDLIGELLELSRIKTRRHRIERVDLSVMVNELGDVFEDDLSEKGIALLVDTHLPVLWCERARMRQVLQNLIDNAIKYMGSGETRQIHVGCLDTRDGVELYVRDTGIGIDPEDLQKVFYVFRRGKNTAAVNVAGKGVGLASVKSIIETYDGKIRVESEPGKGSTFRFTIPRRYVAADDGTAAALGAAMTDHRRNAA